jgi:hypothetical protein
MPPSQKLDGTAHPALLHYHRHCRVMAQVAGTRSDRGCVRPCWRARCRMAARRTATSSATRPQHRSQDRHGSGNPRLRLTTPHQKKSRRNQNYTPPDRCCPSRQLGLSNHAGGHSPNGVHRDRKRSRRPCRHIQRSRHATCWCWRDRGCYRAAQGHRPAKRSGRGDRQIEFRTLPRTHRLRCRLARRQTNTEVIACRCNPRQRKHDATARVRLNG